MSKQDFECEKAARVLEELLGQLGVVVSADGNEVQARQVGTEQNETEGVGKKRELQCYSMLLIGLHGLWAI